MLGFIKAAVPVKVKHKLSDLALISKYASPNLLAPSVPLSPQGQEWLKILKRDGIVRIDSEKFHKMADYLNEAYYAKLDACEGRYDEIEFENKDLFVKDYNAPKYRAGGNKHMVLISYKDPNLADLFFDPDYTGLLYNYQRRQAYYRNQPVLWDNWYDGDEEKKMTNSNWHADHMHQVSCMLFCNDLTEETTHMQYCLGAHKRSLVKDGIHPPQEKIDEDALKYPTVDLVGPKGTLYVFDSGGYHRGCYVGGTQRKLVHICTTTGHHIKTDQRFDNLDTWPELSQYAPHARRMMDKLGVRNS